MTNEDKMLQLILSDENLVATYKYNPNDYQDMEDALNAEEPVVVAVATILRDLGGSTDRTLQRQVYQTIFQYLNNNLLA